MHSFNEFKFGQLLEKIIQHFENVENDLREKCQQHLDQKMVFFHKLVKFEWADHSHKSHFYNWIKIDKIFPPLAVKGLYLPMYI